jgi:hypothetical protein
LDKLGSRSRYAHHVRQTNLALDGLRTTLLAACGLTVGACTSVPAELPLPDQTDQAKDEPKPKPDPTPEPTPVTATACVNATPVVIDGEDSGYLRCEDGALNRAKALRCTNPINAPACKGTESRRDCQTHADCTDKPHGFCMGGSGQIGTYCGCIYPCLDDSECGAGEACMCPDVAGRGPSAAQCAPAQCKVDADCPSGECGATYHFNGCYHDLSLQCRTSADACRSDAQCDDNGSCAARAREHDEGAGVTIASFECARRSCVIGRPLTVDSGVRVASVSARPWGATRIQSLSSSRSRARAAYWLEIAQMEHASVASFARFVHELMRFGAPPRLLREALAAAADEVRHAEQTFALASAYAGASVGPGALRVDDLHPTADLEVFVTRLIREGCVGETLGVAEALALLEHELDPALRPRLELIAADETRHAGLAWRTLRWIAGRVEPEVIERAFREALAQVACVDEEPVDTAHGRLGREAKRRVRAQAITRVVEPCRRELRRAHASGREPSPRARWS